MRLLKSRDGFTYIDIFASMTILIIMVSVLIGHRSIANKVRINSDEVNKMTMVVKGVMEVYRELGKDEALNYGQRYNVSIIEDSNTGHANLVKVKIIVSSNSSEINPVILVTYHSN